MQWGYALVWPHQFNDLDPDPVLARLQVLDRFGLRWMQLSARELSEMEPDRRERILSFVQDRGLGLIPSLWGPWMNAPREESRADLRAQVDLVLEWAGRMQAPIIHCGVASTHRFADRPNLAEQMEILADLLAEPARRCADAGRPLAIENHGDYYVSDLVALIGEVPELRLFLDTGNTFLIGEKPVPAFCEAAPFVVGGHFKDHKVGPRTDEGPLRFEIGPAVLGEGDVPLRECFDILRQHTPDFDRVAMLIELIPPSFAGDDNVRAFEQSVAFVKSLEAGRG